PVDTPGAGSVTVVLDPTAQTIQILASFFGLTAPDTAAHIHCCQTMPGTATRNGFAGSVCGDIGWSAGHPFQWPISCRSVQFRVRAYCSLSAWGPSAMVQAPLPSR